MADEENIKPPEKPKRNWIWWVGIGLLAFILILVIFALIKSNTIKVKDIGWALLVVFILSVIGLAVYFLVKYIREKNKPVITEKPHIKKWEAKEMAKELMKKDHYVTLDMKDTEIDAVKNIGKENHPKIKIYHLKTRDTTTGKKWDVMIRMDNPEESAELQNKKKEEVDEALNQLADFKEPENTIIQESRDPITQEITRTITRPTPLIEQKPTEEEEVAEI